MQVKKVQNQNWDQVSLISKSSPQARGIDSILFAALAFGLAIVASVSVFYHYQSIIVFNSATYVTLLAGSVFTTVFLTIGVLLLQYSLDAS